MRKIRTFIFILIISIITTKVTVITFNNNSNKKPDNLKEIIRNSSEINKTNLKFTEEIKEKSIDNIEINQINEKEAQNNSNKKTVEISHQYQTIFKDSKIESIPLEKLIFKEVDNSFYLDYEKAKENIKNSIENNLNNLKDEKTSHNVNNDSGNLESTTNNFLIEKIVFNNVEKLHKELYKIKVKYEGKNLSFNHIEKLLEEANNLYLKNGYVTTRVKLKVPQNLEDGSLELEVINGYIEKITLNKNNFRDKSVIFTAFPIKKGAILRLKDIEQGIIQMNSLQSNNAKMKILPGSQYGYSIIEVTNEPTKRFSLVLGFDNMGQESTEKNRGKLNLYLDNLLGINDSITINYQNTLNSDQDKKNSINYGLNLSFPIDYYTFTLGVSKSTYLNTVKGNNNIFTSSGDTLTHHYTLKRLIESNVRGNSSVSGTLMLKDDKNYIEGVKLDKSSKKLSVLRLGFSKTFRISQGSLSSSLDYYQGLKAFDALKSDLAQFEKYTFNNNFIKFFNLGLNQFSYNLNFNSQYANKVLYGVEKINIGDLYTVRGFKNNSISGERGFYAKNTLSYIFDKDVPILKGSSLFLGFDYGLTEDLSYKEGSKYEKIEKVAGISIGYKYTSKHLNLDLTLAKPLEEPEYFQKEKYIAYFNLSLIY